VVDNVFNPRKLLHSKWTAVAPQRKEKHFMVVACHADEEDNLIEIELEAVLTRRVERLPWQTLRSSDHWLQGWR